MMDGERLADPVLRRECVRTVLPGGLAAAVFPFPGFARQLAALSVDFGSTDAAFARPGGGLSEVPDGTAHFLEHRVFTGPQGPALERFAARGAAVNAGTSFTRTTYYFVSTDDFFANLEDLLRFVFTPLFEPAGVDKERKIIEQEIRMYEDVPRWRVYFGLLRCLYSGHPVRRNPAGTPESIARIDAPLLAEIHRLFYHPANMTFFAGGDLDPREVFAAAARVLAEREPGPAEKPRRVPCPEPAGAAAPAHREKQLVSRPLAALGFKGDAGRPGPALYRRHLVAGLLLDVLCGEASPLHERLYDRGLIDETFGAFACDEDDFSFTVFSGETADPEGLAAAVGEEIAALARRGVPPADLERARRKALGQITAGFDSVEAVSGVFLEAARRGVSPFAWREALAGIAPAELGGLLAELGEDRRALSVVEPLG